ncbi:MAG: efflux RND transporter permease subunit [Caulobacterales bacterium]|nr:efflux RND transporter permease subunit [Caulobacterales bacterium]
MAFTRLALKYPAAVAVGLALIFLAGAVSLSRLPIQLFPDINQPQLAVQTFWRAASPREMEAEIVEPQEEAFAGLSGLERMQAWANQGESWINLTFAIGTDMGMAAADLNARINRLPPLPADADGPDVILSGFNDSNTTLSFFFIQSLPGDPLPLPSHVSWVADTVVPRIESVEGVSRAELQWGRASRELAVTLDPFRAAELGVTIPDIAAALADNADVSAGQAAVGRRRYTLRFEGEYDPAELEAMVVDWRDGRPVTIGDVADVDITFGERTSFTYQNGNPALGMRVFRENGANLLATLERVKAEIAEINATIAAERQLHIAQSFDASVFINRAISLLRNNLVIGVSLAVFGLWLFLRRARATLLISLTIPICLLSTFIVLQLLGRTLNVISLAGLAFATGMVLDAAIVMLENIVRRRESGEDPETAAAEGAGQVWGALLASTTTTVAIFLPIVFLEDVEGQIFADLAITIAVGVSLSLLAAVTVLPVATVWFMKDRETGARGRRGLDAIADAIMVVTGGPLRRATLISAAIAAPIALTWQLFPDMDYLPPVKRDAVDAWISFPPGMDVDVADREIAQAIIARLQPYMDGDREPALLNYYLGMWEGGGRGALGVRALDQGRVRELEQIVRDEILADLPDLRAFAYQGSLFGGFGDEGEIQVHLQAGDYAALGEPARLGEELLREAFPGVNINANPDPGSSEPTLSILPDDRRIQEAGWSRGAIATIVRTLGAGEWIGEYFDGESRLDVILRTPDWATPDEFAAAPLATPIGGVAHLGDFVRIERGVGPSNIQRVDGRRTITLNVSQPPGMALEEALDRIAADIEPSLRAALPYDASITYGGSADSLKRAIRTMGQNFLFAIVILFLILAGLFGSVRDALLVIVSIPLATVGGVAALWFLNDGLGVFQPLDLLTMMGFIILLGLVINNAILLVDQTRAAERRGVARRAAVDEALHVRLRPILMSTLTSILGMTPLLAFPGEGSAIYRGLAASIVGGMSVSLIFTLLLLPSLLRLGETRAARRLPADAARAPAQ